MPNCKVNILMFRPTERALQGIDIAMPQLFDQERSAGALLLLLIKEGAVFEGKSLKNLAHKQWKLFASPRVGTIMASVYKGVLFHGVAMQVTEEHHITDFLNAEYQFFEIEYFRVINFRGIFPFFVKIVP